MKNYDEASVVRDLNKKQGCSVSTHNKTITISRGIDSLGNKSWGKIDYLVKVHKYVYVFTSSSIKPVIYADESRPNKSIKRENKLNMVDMTKNAMKKAKR